MVTTRVGSGSLDTLSRTKFTDIIKLLGRTDVSWTTYTNTLNQSGRLSAQSSTTTIIDGSLQFVTVKDKQWIDLGFAKIGDGIFYTYYNYSLKSEDIIVVDSVTWELSKQIEGETINGNLVYQAWIVKRREEG